MKIRNGFVSNSSSSSFIVGLPKGLNDDEKRELLYKKMNVNEDSFFFFAAKGIADCIIKATPIKSREALMDDYCYDSIEDFKKDYPHLSKLFCKNYKFDIYSGRVTNDSYKIGEQLFCEIEWEVNDDDFYINKEAY